MIEKYKIESNIPIPKRSRRKKMTNYDELAKRGAEGLSRGIYETRIEAGRELAREAKNYTCERKKGKTIYKEHVFTNASEQVAQRLARMIGKVYQEQKSR